MKNVFMIEIIDAVCTITGVSHQDLQKNTRKREIAEARHLCMYFAKKNTNLTLHEIGSYLGDKDHATASYGAKKIIRLMELEPSMKGQVERIDEFLNEPANKFRTTNETLSEYRSSIMTMCVYCINF